MTGIPPEYPAAEHQDVMSRPATIRLGNGQSAFLKVDALVVENGVCALGGWQSEPLVIDVMSDGKKLPILHLHRFMREDVNRYLRTDSASKHGFGLAFACDAGKQYGILAGAELLPLDLNEAEDGMKNCCESVFGDELVKFMRSRQGSVQAWKYYVESGLSPLKCGLDHALRWPDESIGNPVIVSGWLALTDDINIYVGDGQQYFTPEMQFFTRPDIANSHDIFAGNNTNGNGFVFVLKDYPAQESKIAIYADKNGTKAKIAERNISEFYGYRSFLKAAFEIDFPHTEMANIYQRTFMSLLSEIQQKRVKAIMAGSHKIWQVGHSVSEPSISVIIPLYGTLESLKIQVQRFAWDQAFDKFTELIYIISDPGLFESFKLSIAKLGEKYNIALRYVYAYASLGFAEACNLGAEVAKGEYLIFVNSDVYPVQPGWLQSFRELLAVKPKAGIVGCHLINPDGTSQHCGVYLKQHSFMDICECIRLIDNENKTIPARVPYVLGACMAIRKSDFIAVGGFNTDYIIGNFEDLDICERIRTIGKDIWYLPMVKMAHVEHGSFKCEPQGKWLDRLWVYNALIFSKNWRKAIN